MMITFDQRSWGSRSRMAGALVLTATALTLGACSSRSSMVSTRTTTTEQRVAPAPAPPKMIDISIQNLHDEPSADPTQEKVVGVIVNDGDKRVSGLSVKVNALDRGGNVVHTITTPPIAQPIDPYGGRATFEAYMPKNPAVAGYHAVAIAR